MDDTPRKKAAKNSALLSYLSAKRDNKDGRFIQVGNSLLLSPQFQDLSATARILYLSMAMEAAGRPTTKFSHSAGKKYGIPPSSLDRAAKELREHGFIELIMDENRSQFKTNEYRFLVTWKADPAPHFGEGKPQNPPRFGEH